MRSYVPGLIGMKRKRRRLIKRLRQSLLPQVDLAELERVWGYGVV
jgi:hypothetical protein